MGKVVKKKVAKKKIDAKSALKSLSLKHQEVVLEYFKNMGHARKAYKKVYPKSTDAAADVSMSKLLRKPKIKAAIAELYHELWGERESELEKSKTYQLVNAIGTTEISDVIEVEEGEFRVKNLSEVSPEAKHAIQSIEITKKTTQYGIDENIKVRMHSKLPALEFKAKLQNMIKDDDSNIIINVVKAVRPDKQDDSTTS